MAVPVINTVRNTPADGISLAVALAAAPTGSPQFYAHRQPGLAGEVVVMPYTAQPAVGTTVVNSGLTNPLSPRQLVVRGNQASCTGTVIVAGTDDGDQAQTENFVLSGTANVVGSKTWKTITSVTIPTRGAAGDQVRVRSTGTEVIAQSGSGTAWEIDVVSEATEIRLCYYVVVEDTAGVSNEECEWLCLGTNLDVVNQVAGAVQDLLADNRKALHRSLQIWMGDTNWPNGQPAEALKVLKGYPMMQSNNVLPVVSVRIHDLEEDLYFGNPYTDVIPMTGTIYVYMFHQGKGLTLEPAVAALGMGVFNVLNQAFNLDIALDCGLRVKAAHCSNFHVDEELISGAAGYMAIAEMSWKGEVYFGKRLE